MIFPMLTFPCDVCGTRRGLTELHSWRRDRAFCSSPCAVKSIDPPTPMGKAAYIDRALTELAACEPVLASAIGQATAASRLQRRGDQMQSGVVMPHGLLGGLGFGKKRVQAERLRNRCIAEMAAVSADMFSIAEHLSRAASAMMGLYGLGVPVVQQLQPLTQLAILRTDATSIAPTVAVRELQRLHRQLGTLQRFLQAERDTRDVSVYRGKVGNRHPIRR